MRICALILYFSELQPSLRKLVRFSLGQRSGKPNQLLLFIRQAEGDATPICSFDADNYDGWANVSFDEYCLDRGGERRPGFNLFNGHVCVPAFTAAY